MHPDENISHCPRVNERFNLNSWHDIIGKFCDFHLMQTMQYSCLSISRSVHCVNDCHFISFSSRRTISYSVCVCVCRETLIAHLIHTVTHECVAQKPFNSPLNTRMIELFSCIKKFDNTSMNTVFQVLV